MLYGVLIAQTHFVADTGVCTVVQESKDCVKMSSLAGKHQSSVACVLWRRIVHNVHIHV